MINETAFLEANNIKIRKKTSILPIALLTAAAATTGIYLYLEDGSNAKMPVLFIAILLFIFGTVKLFNMPTAMVHNPSNEELHKEELFFEANLRNSVLDMLRNGDFSKLRANAMDNSNHPLKVELYCTASGKFAAYRVYHYVPYAFEPLTEYETYKK